MDRVGSQAKDLLRSQPSLLRTIGMGACLLILGFMVLRPLGKQAVRLMEVPRLAAPAEVAAGAGAVLAAAPAQLEASAVPVAASNTLPPMGSAAPDAQNVFDRVTEHIKTEPAASARLIQAWIGGPEETE